MRAKPKRKTDHREALILKKLILIVVLVLVAAAFLPVRPAMRAPEVTRLSLEADDKKSASLVRILNTDKDALNAVSVYCYGLAADRLAARQGANEPTRVTIYFDGLRYVGATTTFQGAGEYFDLSGRSAEQLDGLTFEQWAAQRE